MNPEQQNGQQSPLPQTPQPGTPGHDPYDFIMNPDKPVKKPAPLLPSGNSTMQRLAIFGGGLVILIIIGAIVAGIVSSSGKAGTDELVTVAQYQTELARIATAGTQASTTATTQNLANNIQVSMTSARSDLLTYLENNHHKVGTKELGLKRSTATDTTLTSAQTNGTYDATFTTVVQTELTSYEQALQKAYNTKPGPKGEKLLNSQYQAAKLLDTESKQ